MKLPKLLAAGTAAGLLLMSMGGAPALAAPIVSVPTAAAAAVDPGPAGDFSWEGYNWQKRGYGGGPHFNGQFSAANVSGPDADGHVTLSLTNPTGNAPVASEMISTKRGWGYGTYQTTVEKDLSAMQDETVWGCLFTYDPAAAPGYTEIDLCEASAWGGGPATNPWPILQGHGYWHDDTKAPGVGSNTINFPVTSNANLTHKMVWEPGKITFETFAGESAAGTLLKRTVLEGATVPVPANESIHFNLWATGAGGGSPSTMKPETAVLKDFSFTPRGSTVPVPVTPDPAPAPTPGTAWGSTTKAAAPVAGKTTAVSVTITAPAGTQQDKLVNVDVRKNGSKVGQAFVEGVDLTGTTTRTLTLPALPAGDYELVTMVFDDSSWDAWAYSSPGVPLKVPAPAAASTAWRSSVTVLSRAVAGKATPVSVRITAPAGTRANKLVNVDVRKNGVKVGQVFVEGATLTGTTTRTLMLPALPAGDYELVAMVFDDSSWNAWAYSGPGVPLKVAAR